MGFLDRVKAVRGAYRQVDANIERWARITAIDPGPSRAHACGGPGGGVPELREPRLRRCPALPDLAGTVQPWEWIGDEGASRPFASARYGQVPVLC
jgi:hypothetical protein